jgi:FemAB-related protein (PEP-CTERM system-associated)
MRVITSDQIRDKRVIDRYVAETESSTLYHRTEWTSVIEKCFGHKSVYLLCVDRVESVRGILPLVHMKSRLFGNFMVSMPFFNYGGICADTEESQFLMIEEAVRVAKDAGASHIEFRQESPLQNRFPVKTSKVSMRLGLPQSESDLWKSLPSKLRSQIRKPQKEGMTVRISRHEELDNFHRIFSANMRDLGTPVFSKHFFRNILDHFPENSWICTVYAGKTPVASGFLLGFKEKLEIPWASSLREYNRLGPNMLLYWSCLGFACNHGFRVFDFGRSTVGGGTYRFKEQWGAYPVPLYWHYWLKKETPIPELNPGNPKFRLAINLWKKLPLPVTRYLGPLIVKNLP